MARSTSISRVLRQVSRKTRGLPLDRVLPAAGFLLGLTLCWAAWAAFRDSVLSYRGVVGLKASAPGREGDAAALLRDHLLKPEGRQAWDELVAQKGLGGPPSFSASLDEKTPGAVKITASGRPDIALRQALNQLTNLLADPKQTRLTMRPAGYAKRRENLEKQRADAAARKAARQAEADKLPPNERDKLDDLAYKLRTAEEKRGHTRQALQAAGDEAAIASEIGKLEAERVSLPPANLSDLDRQKLKIDREKLGRLLLRSDRQDCSPEHPVVRRLYDLDRLLRADELPAAITERQQKLGQIQVLKKSLAEEEGAA